MLTLLLVGMLLVLAMVAGGAVAGASSTAARPATTVIVAQPGESLWSIATSRYPDADPREMVGRIRDLNGLDDAVIRPGQSVIVPAQPQ